MLCTFPPSQSKIQKNNKWRCWVPKDPDPTSKPDTCHRGPAAQKGRRWGETLLPRRDQRGGKAAVWSRVAVIGTGWSAEYRAPECGRRNLPQPETPWAESREVGPAALPGRSPRTTHPRSSPSSRGRELGRRQGWGSRGSCGGRTRPPHKCPERARAG